MLVVVLVNSLALAWADPTKDDAEVNRTLYWLNFVCTIIYLVEAAAKVCYNTMRRSYLLVLVVSPSIS
jgi:hypothetical protein